MYQIKRNNLCIFVSTMSKPLSPKEKTVTGDQMQYDIVLMSMNDEQRKYSFEQFWNGAAVGGLVGVISGFIGMYFYLICVIK